jgi:hypothetical protein
MIKHISIYFYIGCIFIINIQYLSNDNVFINEKDAEQFPGYIYQGEYVGQINQSHHERIDIGLQIASIGRNEFRAMLYEGGLPGDVLLSRDLDIKSYELKGKYEQNHIILEGEITLIFVYNEGKINLYNGYGESVGFIEKVFRESTTLGMKPPKNAIVLFDGSDLNHFTPETQMDENGLLVQGATTRQNFGDKRIHIEAKLGFMPEHINENRANSGIYIQNRYEVQILDSFAQPVFVYGNGALYNEVKPKINVSYPPLRWQTYDIFFRAPRFDEDGTKLENARLTVYLNGVLIHEQVELESGTGAGGRREEVVAGELVLQNHGGDPVRFRNIWIVEGDITPPASERLY